VVRIYDRRSNSFPDEDVARGNGSVRGAFRHHYLMRFRNNALSIAPGAVMRFLRKKRQGALARRNLELPRDIPSTDKNPAMLIFANDPK
jgi:hypothetical protein